MMAPQRSPQTNSRPSGLHVWQITAVQDLFWIALALSTIWFGYYLRSIFTPVLIGLVMAYIFNPVISYAQDRWRVPRSLTICVLIILLLFIAAVFIARLGPVVVEQLGMFAQKLPDYIEIVATRYHLNLASAAEEIKILANRIQRDPISILQNVFTGTGQAFGFIGSVIGATTYVVVSFALIPIYFFFFAWSWLPFMTQKNMEAYLPASQRQQILEISQDMNKAVAGFLRGRLLVGFLMAVMFAVGWLLANVPYWFLLGVSGGILGIIPYASGAVWLLAVLLKYLNVTVGKNVAGLDWMVIAGWPTVVYIIVQFIEGWVLTPWVQSEETNLSPVAVLVVVFIGGGVAGLYGLILAVPVAACLKIFAVKILLPRLRQWAASS